MAWAKYKNSVMNLNRVTAFKVRKISKREAQGLVVHSEVRIGKDEKWLLSADYMDLDAFKDKNAALRVAEDIVNGKYNVKER